MLKISATFLSLAFIFLSVRCHAQGNILRGEVADSITGEPLIGVSIITGPGQGTTTDASGRFVLKIDKFPFSATVSFLGFETKHIVINSLPPGNYNILLHSSELALNQVVVAAGKHPQKIEEISQSVEIIKPDFLINTQTNQVDEALQKIPGVTEEKGQVNIWGGSGFSYGAGSRVLVLLDDMPMLSADAGDAKWNYYPVENLDQIEIIKGSSSALYGSSALDGIISLRTALPDTTPLTQIKLFYSIYDKPKNASEAYWKTPPVKDGFTIADMRRIGNFSIVSSINGYRDDGYQQGSTDHILRGNLYVQYKPKNNKILAHISLNGMKDTGQNFLYSNNVAQPLIPAPGASASGTYIRWNADGSFKYFQDSANTHTIRTRYFGTNNILLGQSSKSGLWYSEYQYQTKLLDEKEIKSTFTTGVTYTLSKVYSDSLYGFHTGQNTALYGQFDQKIHKFNFSLGFRFEANKQDTSKWDYFPVFRSGINYQAAKGTFLRFSLGQGFRYPSVAERYISTIAGGIAVFPDPNLKPETGWNTELGIKQLFGTKSFKGYIDGAVFVSEYQDMIEYEFGPAPGGIGAGFSAQNITNTQVTGFEITTGFEEKLRRLVIDFYGGYTHVIPLNTGYNPKTDTIAEDKYLKYRRSDLLRGNLDLTFGKVSFGTYAVYNSPFLNIDQYFLLIIKGLGTNGYWKEYSSGTTFDFRLSYKLVKWSTLSFVVKNAFNAEYMQAPGNTIPPRTYTLQAIIAF